MSSRFGNAVGWQDGTWRHEGRQAEAHTHIMCGSGETAEEEEEHDDAILLVRLLPCCLSTVRPAFKSVHEFVIKIDITSKLTSDNASVFISANFGSRLMDFTSGPLCTI